MESEEKFKSKVVHTFSDDMVDALGENPGGSLRQIIAEQEEKEKERMALSPNTPENRVFIGVSALLILLSLAGLGYIFITRDTGAVSTQNQSRPLIFVDRTQFVPADNLDATKTISALKSAFALSSVKQGGIEGFYLTRNKKVLAFEDFAKITATNLPNRALSMIEPSFLVGVVKTSTYEPFILIKVRSFQDIFPEMTAWEEKMFYDLHSFFGWSLGAENNALLNTPFQNGFVANKNARILYRADESIGLMYIYADETSVIITKSNQAAQEVMRRLAGSIIRK